MDAIHSTGKLHFYLTCVICLEVQQTLRFETGRKSLSMDVDQSASEHDDFCKLQERSSTFAAAIVLITRGLACQLFFEVVQRAFLLLKFNSAKN